MRRSLQGAGRGKVWPEGPFPGLAHLTSRLCAFLCTVPPVPTQSSLFLSILPKKNLRLQESEGRKGRRQDLHTHPPSTPARPPPSRPSPRLSLQPERAAGLPRGAAAAPKSPQAAGPRANLLRQPRELERRAPGARFQVARLAQSPTARAAHRRGHVRRRQGRRAGRTRGTREQCGRGARRGGRPGPGWGRRAHGGDSAARGLVGSRGPRLPFLKGIAEGGAPRGRPGTPRPGDVRVPAPRLGGACGHRARAGGKGHIWAKRGASQPEGGTAARREAQPPGRVRRKPLNPCAPGAPRGLGRAPRWLLGAVRGRPPRKGLGNLTPCLSFRPQAQGDGSSGWLA